MFLSLPDHAKGLLLAAFGGLMLTLDIPILRLASGEPWSVMLIRSAYIVAVVVFYVVLRRAITGRWPVVVPGAAGLATAALYGLTAVSFLIAVFHTSTANLVFILAFNPMFAALLSWFFLGERPRPATLAAMAAMAVGVLVIVHDGLGHGHVLGDMLALVSGISIAGAITISRGSGRDMSFTPMVGALAPLLVAAAMVSEGGVRVDLPWWLALNGIIVIPISFFCLAMAPRYLSGPEVSMFFLLETVLTPVWVWIIFAETPSRQSAIGGLILIAALAAHSIWQLHAGQRRRQMARGE